MDILTLSTIRSRLRDGRYVLSDHALRRVVERNISAAMICRVGADAEIIEDYPDDKYSPSCLLLGFTGEKEPLHLHVSRADQPRIKIITLYEPDPTEWLEYRKRKDHHDL